MSKLLFLRNNTGEVNVCRPYFFNEAKLQHKIVVLYHKDAVDEKLQNVC